eukprot:4479196-Pleurochrysis_carterae.AAC.2
MQRRRCERRRDRRASACRARPHAPSSEAASTVQDRSNSRRFQLGHSSQRTTHALRAVGSGEGGGSGAITAQDAQSRICMSERCNPSPLRMTATVKAKQNRARHRVGLRPSWRNTCDARRQEPHTRANGRATQLCACSTAVRHPHAAGATVARGEQGVRTATPAATVLFISGLSFSLEVCVLRSDTSRLSADMFTSP